jgi:hypothetical protein
VPPEVVRGLVSPPTVVTRIGRECGGIPVGSEAAVRVVPVGLVGVVAVRLPVGAVSAPPVAATDAGAALALTETSRDTILPSGLEIRGDIE